jgi:hypothetical protein
MPKSVAKKLQYMQDSYKRKLAEYAKTHKPARTYTPAYGNPDDNISNKKLTIFKLTAEDYESITS